MEASTKLFHLDKNYILKEAQEAVRIELLTFLVERIKVTYEKCHNPLGLVDDTVLEIRKCKTYNFEMLEDFYYDLAGIFRYRNADNQLELRFDGITHYDVYQQDWIQEFKKWIMIFEHYDHFQKAILEAAIFSSSEKKNFLAGARLLNFIQKHFGLKVYKYKGIMSYKGA